MSKLTNGVWTDRNGFEIAVYGEAGELWPSQRELDARCLPVATYEPTAWDDNGDESAWQVIHAGGVNGTVTFPAQS